MVMLRHPITQLEYRKRTDGKIEVVSGDGVKGVFDREGNWVEGPRRVADAALCFWLVNAIDKALPGNLAAAHLDDDKSVTEVL
jgi:hypothetical protein